MAIFDDVWETRELEDPEERQAEELRRGKKKWGKTVKAKNTSVSAGVYMTTMRILTLLVMLVLLAFAAFVIYQGVMLFIPE